VPDHLGVRLALEHGADPHRVLVAVVGAGVQQVDAGVVDHHGPAQACGEPVDGRLDRVLRHDRRFYKRSRTRSLDSSAVGAAGATGAAD
jgi:hypothetical protein